MTSPSLGIYYSDVWKKDGRLFSIGPFAKYVDYIATKFRKVVLIAPTTVTGRYDLTYEIKSPNVQLFELPFFSTAIESIKLRRQIIHRLTESVSHYDVLWTRYPGPYADKLCRTALKAGKKVLMQIVGDPLDAVKNTDKYKGLKRYAAIAYASYKERSMMKMTGQVPVFANGNILYDKFSQKRRRKNVQPIISSTLVDEDYHSRVDTCLGEKIKILYIGYFQPRKGLTYLLEAFEKISKRYKNVELVLVGDGEEKQKLEDLMDQLKLKNHVRMPGWLPMGTMLNQAYQESDIFVFPTIAGEGTPRAILGAMANSLPVISTRTAGIPDVLRHGENGLLVEPRSSADLEKAISEIIDNSMNRKKYIQNGYQTARQHSMHNFLDRMFEAVL